MPIPQALWLKLSRQWQWSAENGIFQMEQMLGYIANDSKKKKKQFFNTMNTRKI